MDPSDVQPASVAGRDLHVHPAEAATQAQAESQCKRSAEATARDDAEDDAPDEHHDAADILRLRLDAVERSGAKEAAVV